MEALHAWLHDNNIDVLNVAGPRQSSGNDPYDAIDRLLRGLLT